MKNNVAGQQHIDKSQIVLFKTGNKSWPITLTRQPFEGEFLYSLTFRNAQSRIFKLSAYDCLQYEFRSFGRALQKALDIDTSHAVKFIDGEVGTAMDKNRSRQVICYFSSGAVFQASESTIKKLIKVIATETSDLPK